MHVGRARLNLAAAAGAPDGPNADSVRRRGFKGEEHHRADKLVLNARADDPPHRAW